MKETNCQQSHSMGLAIANATKFSNAIYHHIADFILITNNICNLAYVKCQPVKHSPSKKHSKQVCVKKTFPIFIQAIISVAKDAIRCCFITHINHKLITQFYGHLSICTEQWDTIYWSGSCTKHICSFYQR